MRTLIRGGTVVNPTGPQPADVLIDGETIAGVLSPAVAAELTADEVIDAAGCYVIPGGVDAHTHMQMPFGGTTASDTFETGTAAAAWGGTTTIIDFAIQTPGEVGARVPGALARQGGGRLRHRLRVPHDPRRGRRRVAQGHGRR